ncbi:hypothetical protein ACHAWF_003735 [Thalassiosira exigua]
MSSIRLELNGRTSSTNRTRQLNVKFFHIKDMVDRGEPAIEFCPTEEMWADVFTKLLQGQGSTFRLTHRKLLNCEENYVNK